MSDEMLWFLNRGTGFVLLGVLTATVILGVLASRGRAGSLVPAFVSRALHRNLSLFGAVLLVVHIATAVLDEFVDIRGGTRSSRTARRTNRSGWRSAPWRPT